MNAPKKIVALLTATLVAGSVSINIGNAQVKDASSEILVGAGRYETTIKISANGWSSASEAVIVNDSALADALSATPFAKAKNAPILLTQSKSLDNRTKSELKRLGVKKVYLIGGKSVLGDAVESQLKSEGISIDRISGTDRYYTSLELAKRLDSNKKISKIAVVNGAKGLADAVSVGAPAAQNNIPIILADPIQGTQVSDSFIKSKSIKTSYVIGGESVVSNNISSKLPNSKRLAGSTRNETNVKVIDEFYPKSDINNVYITKDGGKGENQLIDALSVGVLAAKKESPVMLVSNGLTQTQKNLINSKNLNKVVQVGGQGNEAAFELVKSQQKKNTYTVKDIEDLNSTISKADANDVVTIDTRDDVDENITIKTNYAISVILKGDYTRKVTINMPNGDITNEGDIDEVVIENLKYGTFTNEGDIDTLRVEDTQGGKIINDDDGNIERLEVASNTKNVWIENDGDIGILDNDSDTTVLDNDGDIDDDDAGKEDCLDPDDVEEDDYNGNNSSGSSSKDDDDDDDDYDEFDVDDVEIEDQNTIIVTFDKKTTSPKFYWDGDRIDNDDIEESNNYKKYTIDLDTPMKNNIKYKLTIKKSGYDDYSEKLEYKESLKNYLSDKSTGEYKLSSNETLNGITLNANKVINLNNKNITIGGKINAGDYKLTIKGNGKVTFSSGYLVEGAGDNGVIMVNDTGSSFIGTSNPNGYQWTGDGKKLIKINNITPKLELQGVSVNTAEGESVTTQDKKLTDVNGIYYLTQNESNKMVFNLKGSDLPANEYDFEYEMKRIDGTAKVVASKKASLTASDVNALKNTSGINDVYNKYNLDSKDDYEAEKLIPGTYTLTYKLFAKGTANVVATEVVNFAVGVSSYEELTNALNSDAKDIFVLGDITGNDTHSILIERGVNIKGIGNAKPVLDFGIMTRANNIKISNLKFNINDKVKAVRDGHYAAIMPANIGSTSGADNIIIDNCDITINLLDRRVVGIMPIASNVIISNNTISTTSMATSGDDAFAYGIYAKPSGKTITLNKNIFQSASIDIGMDSQWLGSNDLKPTLYLGQGENANTFVASNYINVYYYIMNRSSSEISNGFGTANSTLITSEGPLKTWIDNIKENSSVVVAAKDEKTQEYYKKLTKKYYSGSDEKMNTIVNSDNWTDIKLN